MSDEQNCNERISTVIVYGYLILCAVVLVSARHSEGPPGGAIPKGPPFQPFPAVTTYGVRVRVSRLVVTTPCFIKKLYPFIFVYKK